MKRITVENHWDAPRACVAMVNGWDIRDLKREGVVIDNAFDCYDSLKPQFENVMMFDGASNNEVKHLAQVLETFIVFVESPIRERDTEAFVDEWNNEMELKDDLESSPGVIYTPFVEHAFVVHNGRIYDPIDPPYWSSIYEISGPDDRYELDYDVRTIVTPINSSHPYSQDIPLPAKPADYEDLGPNYEDGSE